MTLRDRLRARQLPTESVTLPTGGEGDPEVIEMRALRASEWEALVLLHPPTEGQLAQGADWNIATFRPALLGVAVVTPDGEEPLTAQDWAELTASGAMTIGELNLLFDVAVALNDRSPMMTVGKGSADPRS